MGKIMKEGKQYGVGGTQKASEITYGTGTVADALDAIGSIYTANWTANSASVMGTALTGGITLPVGKYLVITHYPVCSTENIITELYKVSGGTVSKRANIYNYTKTYGTDIEFVEVTESSATINVHTASTGSIEFTYTDRGYLRAVKLK